MVQWRRNGTNLSDGPTGHGSYIFGSTTNYLQLLSVQPEDAGDYDVIVTDSCGSVTSTAATLTVIACLPGDMNLDGERDDEDVQGFVNCVLGSSAPTCFCADMDASGSVNGGDVGLFVPLLLGT